ncbi:MAG: hypothetical protein HRF45_03590 [Fimbriimonadia bacterium]|jgi:hypothetical protein
MADLIGAWRVALPKVKTAVTGRTLWQALDMVVPVTMEGDLVVLGVPAQQSNLVGHLRSTPSKRAIERNLSDVLKQEVQVEIIGGDSIADWELIKTKAEHVKDLQEKEYQRSTESKARQQAWESSYEQLSRLNAAVPNKALPQNRARLLVDGLNVIVAAVREQGDLDDLGERNMARLIERLAGYTDVPAPVVAYMVLERLDATP